MYIKIDDSIFTKESLKSINGISNDQILQLSALFDYNITDDPVKIYSEKYVVKPRINKDNAGRCDCFYNYPYLKKNDYLIYGVNNVADIVIPCNNIDNVFFTNNIKNKFKLVSNGLCSYEYSNKIVKEENDKKFKFYIYFTNSYLNNGYYNDFVIHITKGGTNTTIVDYFEIYDNELERLNISGNYNIAEMKEYQTYESLAPVGAFDNNIYKVLKKISTTITSTSTPTSLTAYASKIDDKFVNTNQMRVILPYVSFCEAICVNSNLMFNDQWMIIQNAFYIASTLHMMRTLRPSMCVGTVCGLQIYDDFIGIINKSSINIVIQDLNTVYISYKFLSYGYISVIAKRDNDTFNITIDLDQRLSDNVKRLICFITSCILSLIRIGDKEEYILKYQALSLSFSFPLNIILQNLTNNENVSNELASLLQKWFTLEIHNNSIKTSDKILVSRNPVNNANITLGRMGNSLTDAIYLLIVSAFLATARNVDIEKFPIGENYCTNLFRVIQLIINNKNRILLVRPNDDENIKKFGNTIINDNDQLLDDYKIDKSADFEVIKMSSDNANQLIVNIQTLFNKLLSTVIKEDIQMKPVSFLKLCPVGFYLSNFNIEKPVIALTKTILLPTNILSITTGINIVNCIRTGGYEKTSIDGAIYNGTSFNIYCNEMFALKDANNLSNILKLAYDLANTTNDKLFPGTVTRFKKIIDRTIYISSFDYEWHGHVKLNESHLAGQAIDVIGIKYRFTNDLKGPFFNLLIMFKQNEKEKLLLLDKRISTDKSQQDIDNSSNRNAWLRIENFSISDICTNVLFLKDSECQIGNSKKTLDDNFILNDYSHYIISNTISNARNIDNFADCVILLSPLMLISLKFKDENDVTYPRSTCYGKDFINALFSSYNTYISNKCNTRQCAGLYQHFLLCENFGTNNVKKLNPGFIQLNEQSYSLDDFFKINKETLTVENNGIAYLPGFLDKFVGQKDDYLVVGKNTANEGKLSFSGISVLNVQEYYLQYNTDGPIKSVLKNRSNNHWDHIHTGITDLT